MANLRLMFKNGHWIWDEEEKSLAFVSHDIDTKISRRNSSVVAIVPVAKPIVTGRIQFRDEVALLEKIRFRKLYQRKIDPEKEPEIIVLQDIKDVAFFTASHSDLTLELVEFMHTSTVDRLIRALIIYFQFYLQNLEYPSVHSALQSPTKRIHLDKCILDFGSLKYIVNETKDSELTCVWEKIMFRREEIKYKLTQPYTLEIEKLIRDNLSELRAMVSIDIALITIGAGDVQKYHHFANKNGSSLSGKDRRLHKLMLDMILRIVWLALQRPNIGLLEMEINRLACTDAFNSYVHEGKRGEKLRTTLAEDRILQGTANVKEPRLLQRSPFGKEILVANHDHRMLAMHIVNFPPTDERLEFFEKCYTAPEELLAEMGVEVGILGLKRDDFDEMLVKRKEYKKKMTESEERLAAMEEEEEEEEQTFEFTFIIPDKVIHCDSEIPDAFSEEPPKYQKTRKSIESSRRQCEMWKQCIKTFAGSAATLSYSNE